jgi:hypothetical protein
MLLLNKTEHEKNKIQLRRPASASRLLFQRQIARPLSRACAPMRI